MAGPSCCASELVVSGGGVTAPRRMFSPLLGRLKLAIIQAVVNRRTSSTALATDSQAYASGASGRTRVGGQGASRHLVWLLLLLALPAQGVFPGTVSGQVIDPAVRAGVAAGLTRVIIELRIAPPFTPEGDLPGAAVEAQRQTIARTQDDVIARLAGTSFAVSHRYEGLPLLSLEIGADALARLEGAGDLVARVLPDAPRFRQP